jgi:hypothetical protein
MSPPSTTKSPFDRDPNEVLEHILSFMPWSDDVKCDGPNKRTLNQTLTLMQVSQRFRRLTQLSKLWHQPAFRFEKLIPGRRTASSRRHNALRCSHLVSALFEDAYFKSCLNVKRDWIISSRLLFSVLRKNECLSVNASRIYLRAVHRLNKVIPQLSHCQNVTTLVISDSTERGQLDLGLIAQALPHLKHLTIHLPPNLEGSLQELSELESLNLLRDGVHSQREINNSVLPLESANTLTHLFLGNFALEDVYASQFYQHSSFHRQPSLVHQPPT